MKTVLIQKDCKYAQSKPHLPTLEFEEEEVVEVEDYMATSMEKNGDGVVEDSIPEPEAEVETEAESDEDGDPVEPETKEKPRKPRKTRGTKKE